MNHHCFNGFIYFRGFDRGPRPGHMDSVLQKPLETQGNKQETETIIKGSNWAGFTRETRGRHEYIDHLQSNTIVVSSSEIKGGRRQNQTNDKFYIKSSPNVKGVQTSNERDWLLSGR